MYILFIISAQIILLHGNMYFWCIVPWNDIIFFFMWLNLVFHTFVNNLNYSFLNLGQLVKSLLSKMSWCKMCEELAAELLERILVGKNKSIIDWSLRRWTGVQSEEGKKSWKKRVCTEETAYFSMNKPRAPSIHVQFMTSLPRRPQGQQRISN